MREMMRVTGILRHPNSAHTHKVALLVRGCQAWYAWERQRSQVLPMVAADAEPRTTLRVLGRRPPHVTSSAGPGWGCGGVRSASHRVSNRRRPNASCISSAISSRNRLPRHRCVDVWSPTHRPNATILLPLFQLSKLPCPDDCIGMLVSSGCGSPRGCAVRGGKRNTDPSKWRNTARCSGRTLEQATVDDSLMASTSGTQSGSARISPDSQRPRTSKPVVTQTQVQIHGAAKALQGQGKLQEALSELYRGLTLHPDDLHFLSLAASIELKVGNLRRASRLLADGLRRHPMHAALLATSGLLHARRGELESARARFRAVQESSPSKAAPVLQVRLNQGWWEGRDRGRGESGGSVPCATLPCKRALVLILPVHAHARSAPLSRIDVGVHGGSSWQRARRPREVCRRPAPGPIHAAHALRMGAHGGRVRQHPARKGGVPGGRRVRARPRASAACERDLTGHTGRQ